METIELIEFEAKSKHEIPLFSVSVSAGVPVPAESDVDELIDLNEYLIANPTSTFFARINGDSYKHLGIADQDLLIADSEVSLRDGNTVLVSLNKELTVKIYRDIKGEKYFQSEDNRFVPVNMKPHLDYQIVGVITKVIHSF